MAESPLSDRERELLELVVTGASNKEISQKLFISINTVKVHLRNIFEKLEVASRTEAAMWAVQNGLVDAGGGSLSSEPVEALTGLDAIQAWFISLMPVKRFGLILAIVLPLVILGFGISYLLRPEPEPLSPEVAALVSTLDEDRWQQLADMPTARAGLAAVAYENQIYAIAGEGETGVVGVNERYNPETDTWESLAPKPVPVADVHAGVIGGRIYIPGGRLGTGEITDILEIYDPRQNTWSTGATLPVPLSAYASATLEGKLYLFGGWDGNQYLNSVYQYDPGQDAWAEQTPMPTARGFAGAAVAGSKIYVIGGYDGEKALDVNEEYEPDLDHDMDQAWSTQTSLPFANHGIGVTIASEYLFVIGGSNALSREVHFLNYSSPNMVWNTIASPINSGLNKMAVVNLGTQIYILGGEIGGLLIEKNISYTAFYTVALPIIEK